MTAIEADTELALQAEVNLASWPQIDLVSGGGRSVDVGEGVSRIYPSIPPLARSPSKAAGF
ncbi:hypothetical protein GPL17_26915 [Bradyrhizobium yuanmingense]|uniref:hypothetical protein n=1 Tax=Bradyrhizobium yuanmingense TaxID=108015 RepID=UPI0012FC41F2|nr:hypothetical protein [Bradyrhizobium yuanmingense]MVT54103.1 hypothetical protein [Bradyrhizobium yuanmingense]